MNELTIQVPLEVSFDPKQPEKSKQFITFPNMKVTVHDDETAKDVGYVAGMIGGGVTLQFAEDGRIFYASPKALWNAFMQAFSRPDQMINEEI